MMIDFKDRIQPFLKKGSFRRNVAVMSSGTAISQVLYLLFYPVLTRIYSPVDFGQYAVFIALLSILTIFATGQYELAIMLPKKETAYKRIILATVILAVLLTFFITILLYALAPILIDKFNLLSSPILIPILGASILINSFYQVAIYISLRNKVFSIISIVNIINVIVSISFQYTFFKLGFGPIGLITGFMMGTLVAMALLMYKNRKLFNLGNQKYSFGEIREVFIRYRKFPLFNLPATIVNLLANQSPQLLLNNFSQAVVGNFALSQRVLGSPVSLFSASVSYVFKEKASYDYRNKGSCKVIFLKTFKSLLLISLVPFILIFFLSPALVPIIFGEGWEEAGLYIQILAIMYLLKFTVSPLTYVLIIAEKQKLNFIIQSTLLVLVLISLMVGVIQKSPLLAITLYSMSYSMIYILFFIISYKVSQNEEKNIR